MTTQTTLSILKPDATRRNLTGAINAVIEKSGLKIIGKNELFFLIRHSKAEALHISLKRQKILTRIFDYNSDWMRIGLAMDKNEDERLLEAINGFQK